MALDAETFSKYQQILTKDPKSKLFAALAEAYRERGDLEAAEKLARRGLGYHPDYVAGYVVLGKVLIERNSRDEAGQALQKAVELNPEHLIAYQILADNWTELGDLDQALKAHKMALFLNPLNEKSRKAVEKLEVLSAQQYESDVFQLKSLTPKGSGKSSGGSATEPKTSAKTRAKSGAESGAGLESGSGAGSGAGSVSAAGLEAGSELELSWRHDQDSENEVDMAGALHLGDEGYSVKKALALIDAFIVRGDLEPARKQLELALKEAPAHSELLRRQLILSGDDEIEVPQELEPLPRREDLVVQKKIQLLQRVLDLNVSFFSKRRDKTSIRDTAVTHPKPL